jgi:hypothetical protein
MMKIHQFPGHRRSQMCSALLSSASLVLQTLSSDSESDVYTKPTEPMAGEHEKTNAADNTSEYESQLPPHDNEFLNVWVLLGYSLQSGMCLFCFVFPTKRQVTK